MTNNRLTFVVPCNNEAVVNNNFMASPLFQNNRCHEIKLMWGFKSASVAYNSAIVKAANDLIILAHQDVILPASWDESLSAALSYLSENDPTWGVLGCYGVNSQGIGKGFIYCTANDGYIGAPFDIPQPVQTLDEVLLITRKSSGLRFDEELKDFHLYGTDICLTAKDKCLNSYVIPALCLHNSSQTMIYPKEFYECCDYIRKKWSKYIPIHTTCVSIEKSKINFDIKYRLRNYLISVRNNIFGMKEKARIRSDSPLSIMNELISVSTSENVSKI
jgi:hypothetical protein